MVDRTRRRLAPLIALMILLTGCATPGAQPSSEAEPTAPSTTLTLAEAKSITLDRQDEIAALFPADHVGEVIRPETSRSLYACGDDDTFQWPGVTRIIIVGKVDPLSIIEDIGEHARADGGWAVDEGTSANGFPNLKLLHDDGSRFRVGFYEGGLSSGWMPPPRASTSREGSS